MNSFFLLQFYEFGQCTGAGPTGRKDEQSTGAMGGRWVDLGERKSVENREESD